VAQDADESRENDWPELKRRNRSAQPYHDMARQPRLRITEELTPVEYTGWGAS
jgi:hypothetical protein